MSTTLLKSFLKWILPIPYLQLRNLYYSLKEFMFKTRMIKYLKDISKEKENKEIIIFLKNNKISTFPYYFSEKYLSSSIVVYLDAESGLKYVLHENKRLYFKRDWDTNEVRTWYNGLLMEQDIDSPHRYEYKNFKVNDGDVVIDVGVAEGNFSLTVVERAKKIYLFEADEDWIPVLKKTFEPWKDKVVIINKYVSDKQDDKSICFDDYFCEEKIDFLKIDVEGMEKNVLRGGTKLFLVQKKIKISVCTYHNCNDVEEINNELLANGFNTEFSKGYMIYESWINGKHPSFYIRRGLIRAIKDMP